MTIYIVEGSTGEYSDHTEWPVRAYRTEAAAKEMVELCSAEYRRIAIEMKRLGLDYYDNLPESCIHKYDDRMRMDYNGVNYQCYPVELEDK